LDHLKSSFETNLEFNLISLIESTLLNTDLISLDGVKNNFLWIIYQYVFSKYKKA